MPRTRRLSCVKSIHPSTTDGICVAAAVHAAVLRLVCLVEAAAGFKDYPLAGRYAFHDFTWIVTITIVAGHLQRTSHPPVGKSWAFFGVADDSSRVGILDTVLFN